ncbi:hypothetical protein P5673_009736 [Acropora cervicornis]|uniref:Uncharacterized protein n=1 Tax=Acropora cervicornis TaxID=6130 RepID=A0AAD9QSE8_ACRCE|nr:hypothetical protein P5673_009736 [Acropora cervicornis]
MADEKPSTSATLGASSPVTDIITPNIHLPPKLELSRNLIANWKRFKCLLMNYKITSRLQTQGKDLHVAMLLTYTRPDIYDHLPFTSKDDTSNIGKVLELLEQYCIDETNKTYERYVFNKCDHQQSSGLSVPTEKPIVLEVNKRSVNADDDYFFISKGHMTIRGAQAIQQFQLTTVNTDNTISVDSSLVHHDILNEFLDVFEGDRVGQWQLNRVDVFSVPP